MKPVRKLQMVNVAEDGTESRVATTIYLEGDEFAIKVPPYIIGALGVQVTVRDERQAKCVEKFEKVMRDYRKWILSAKAEPVIVLDVKLIARDRRDADDEIELRQRVHDVSRKAFFLESDVRDEHAQRAIAVVLKYKLAYRVNGRIYDRRECDKKDHFDGKPATYEPGHITSLDESEVALDHTPELEARIARICDALHSAAETLNEICSAEDVARALLTHKGAAMLPAPPAKAVARRKR